MNPQKIKSLLVGATITDITFNESGSIDEVHIKLKDGTKTYLYGGACESIWFEFYEGIIMSDKYIQPDGMVITLNESLVTTSDWNIISNYRTGMKSKDFTSEEYKSLSYEGLKYLYHMADFLKDQDGHSLGVTHEFFDRVKSYNENLRNETENWERLLPILYEELSKR